MKSLYDSGWHHPFVAYVAGIALVIALARRLPFLYGYLLVFVTTILADATVTGAWSPVPLGTTAYTVFSVVFIVLGDFRYFVLLERVARPSRSWTRVLVVSGLVSLIMPVTTGVLTRVVPAMRDDRVLYAVYEGAMVLLVAGFARSRLASPELSAERRTWLVRATAMFAGLYAGWTACDLIILAGVDAGHALRIVPNVLYYGAFLPFVFATAPASEAVVASAAAAGAAGADTGTDSGSTSATSLPSAGSSLGAA